MRRRRSRGTPDDIPFILFTMAQQGLTVHALSEVTGIDVIILQRWLQGQSAISQAQRELIMNVLCLSMES